VEKRNRLVATATFLVALIRGEVDSIETAGSIEAASANIQAIRKYLDELLGQALEAKEEIEDAGS
jgi:hypothetical protein